MGIAFKYLWIFIKSSSNIKHSTDTKLRMKTKAEDIPLLDSEHQ
jgi:hypothetical protein